VRLAYHLDWNVNAILKFVPCEKLPPEVLALQSLKRMEHPKNLCVQAWGDGTEGYGWQREVNGDTDEEFFRPLRLHGSKIEYGEPCLQDRSYRSFLQYNPLTRCVESCHWMRWSTDGRIFTSLDLIRTCWRDSKWSYREFHTPVLTGELFPSTCYRTHTGYCASPALFLAYKTEPHDVLCLMVWHLVDTRVTRESAIVRLPLDERFRDKKTLQVVMAADGTLYLWDNERREDVVCYCV
jgi:hypothetical protein